MMAKNLGKFWPQFWPQMAIFSPRWPSPGPPAMRFTRLYPAPTRSEPVMSKFRPITTIFSNFFSDFIIFWTHRGPILPLQTLKSNLGTIIERSGSKNCPSLIWETYNIPSAVLFYDPIFDYFSTYFWLYHPGDPDHSALCEGSGSAQLGKLVQNEDNTFTHTTWSIYLAIYTIYGQYIFCPCQNYFCQNTFEKMRALFWGALMAYGTAKTKLKRA